MARRMTLDIVVKAVDQASGVVRSINQSIYNTSRDFIRNYGAVSAAIGGVAYGIKRIVDQYGVQEKSELRLANALRQTNQFRYETFESLKDLASAYQNTTNYADDEIIRLQALAIQYGVLPEKMKSVIDAVTNMGAALDMDLLTSLKYVTLAEEGGATMLRRYGVVLDEAKVKSEGLDYVLGAINQKFGGAARTENEAYAGKMKALSDEIGDLTEKIGKHLLPFVEQYRDVMRSLVKTIDELLGKEFKRGKGVAAQIEQHQEAIKQLEKERDIYATTGLHSANNYYKTITEYNQRIIRVKQEILKLQQQQTQQEEAAAKTTKKTYKPPALFGIPNMPDLQMMVEDAGKYVEESSQMFKDTWGTVLNDIVTMFQSSMSNLVKVQGSTVTLMSEGWDRMKEAFLNSIVSMISSFVIQLGTIAALSAFFPSMGFAGVAQSMGVAGQGLFGLIFKDIPKMADGGVVRRPSLVMAGESGPEAIVPLESVGNVGRGMSLTLNLNGTLIEGNEAKWNDIVRDHIIKPLDSYLSRTGKSL